LVDELELGRARLISEDGALLRVLRKRLRSKTENLYLLDWIPEPEADLFDVLVDGTSVVHVELPRGMGPEVAFEVVGVAEYCRRTRLTRPQRRKLEMAVHLSGTRS
jgi:hypothetical protein